jgi:YaiO family outer membrane protein
VIARFGFGVAFAIALALTPTWASAGELDVTGSLSGFSSPGNVYGPWSALSTTYRWNTGADTPSFTFVTRADHDRLAPTNGDGFTFDDYHDWSPRFFTYAALGTASGNVLPTRNFYVEGDEKFGRSLATVFGGGIGVVVNPNNVVQRYINVGPTFYAAHFNVTLRYLQTFTTGRTATGTGIATIQSGETGKTISTLTLLAGDQPPNGIVAPAQTAAFGQRALFAGFGVNHWVGPRGGWTAGVELERLNDRLSGGTLYDRRGIDIGIFRVIGQPLR